MANANEEVKVKPVELGFIADCDPWLLTNTYFPSKVGGKPAWLELENIPSMESMKCRRCNEVLVFMCQVIDFILINSVQKIIFFVLIIYINYKFRYMPHKMELKIAFIERFMFLYVKMVPVGLIIVQSMYCFIGHCMETSYIFIIILFVFCI